MKRSYLCALTLAVASLATGHVLAADASAPKTRAEVRAELLEAIRTGDIVVAGEASLKANELNPHLYPAKPAAQGKTRAQVQAELLEAIRTGDIVVAGEAGLKANELYPHLYRSELIRQATTGQAQPRQL